MPNNFYHDPCNPCNPCPPVPECNHCHDCCKEPEKRCQPTYCGPVDTTKMCDYYDVQHMDCGCDCGYHIPKVPPLPPEFNSLTESQQLYGLDRKMNELICMVNGHNREVEKIYCEIVNSAKANDAYYWREIKTEEGYLEDASSPYKVVHIPFLDCGGQPIYLELGLAYNNTTNSGIKENVFSCSQRTFADKLVPAMNVANAWVGATVFKGAPITEINNETPDGYTFGVTHSGFLKVYKNLKDYKQMGLDKIRNAMMAHSILMENGAVSPNYYGADKETLQGRVGVGMNYNTKERFIIIIDTGATADMLANLFAKYNCTVAVELATGTSSVAMDKGAFMFMPAGIEPTTNPMVPEINAFWYITKRRHYRNDYVRDVASLTQKFGEQLWRTAITNGVVDNLKLSVGDLYTKLAEEIERAQAAEKQLQDNIDAEQARAEAAEEQLQANIDAERERAEQAESELDERITSEVATLNERIDNEVEAIENEDAAIRELIAQEVEKLNQSITTETQERKNKSVVSVERVEEDGNRVLYKLVLGDGSRLEVPIEVYDYASLVIQLQKFDEYDQRINAEAEARKNADDALGAEIDTERNERTAADTELLNTFNNYLPLVGGTMTGPITLPGDPTDELQAATKKYVDEHSSNIPIITVSTKLDTLNSGFYLLESGGSYLPFMFLRVENTAMIFIEGDLELIDDLTDKTFQDTTEKYYGTESRGGEQLFTVNNKRIVDVNDPTEQKDAANKQYVDNAVAQAGGIPEYEITALYSSFNGYAVITVGSDKVPVRVNLARDICLVEFNGVLASIPVSSITPTTTWAQLFEMVNSNPYLANIDEGIVTKKYADQTYARKTDYDTLNGKVQELEETIATLTQTVANLQ